MAIIYVCDGCGEQFQEQYKENLFFATLQIGSRGTGRLASVDSKLKSWEADLCKSCILGKLRPPQEWARIKTRPV